MLVSDVVRAVEVSIETVSTGAAFEEGLGATIRPMLVATFRAHLAGVTGVNLDYINTTRFGFFSHELKALYRHVKLGWSSPSASITTTFGRNYGRDMVQW